jgi:hypothetical protein
VRRMGYGSLRKPGSRRRDNPLEECLPAW